MNPIKASHYYNSHVVMDVITLGLRLVLILSLVIPQIPLGLVHAQEKTEVSEGDWPSYRNDNSGTGFTSNEDVPIPPLEQTSSITFTSNLVSYNPPVIAGGFLFIVEENGLCAYSLENGVETWCFETMNEIKISSAEGSNIYVYGSDLETGTISVVTLDIATGEVLGRLDLGRSPEESYACSPMNGDYIYCAIDATLTSADLSGNEIKWSKEIDGLGLVPVIVENTLVVRTDQSIFSMNATSGEENWNISLPVENGTQPLVFNGKVIVDGGEKEFIAFNLLSGVELWRLTPTFGDPCQSVYGDENLVVSTSQGVLEEIDPENGEILWTYIPASEELNSCPGMAMANGHVYTSDITGAIQAIELETGTEVWSTLLPERTTPVGLAIANGTLAVLASPNQTFLFSSINLTTPTPEIPTIVAEPTIELTETPEQTTVEPTGEIDTETPVTETPEEPEVVTEEPIEIFEPTIETTNTPSPAPQIDETEITIEETVEPDVVPSLSSISPTFAMKGDLNPITLTLTGTGFSDTSQVKWNNTELSKTSTIPTQITVEIPVDLLSVAGDYSITVYNPDPEGGTSNTLQFTVAAHFPDYDQQLATKIVTFDWDDIPGATKYRLQLSLDDFSTLVFDIKTTASNYAYLTKLIKRTTYSWQIKARVNDTWSGWSQTMNFRSIDPPLASTLLTPEFGLKTNDSTPTFSWSSLENGDKYLIQVSKYTTFSPTLLTKEINDTDYTYGEGESLTLTDGLYYWRVRAIDKIGDIDVKGAWSTVWSFKVDTKPPSITTLYKPKDGAVKIGTPKYVWLLATGAKFYQWEYSENDTFNEIIHTSPMLTTTSYIPPLQAPGTYYWRVLAFDKAGNSSPSAYRSITIEPTVPVAPALLSPANGSTTITNFPTFEWDSVDYGATYRFQWDTEVTFGSPDLDLIQSEQSFTADFLANGTYYWRLKAINTKFEESPWSTVFSVTIDAPLDNTPPTDPSGLTSTYHTVDVYSSDPEITMEWNPDASDGDGVGISGFSIVWNQVESEMPDSIVDLAPDVTTVTSEPFEDGTYYFHLRTCDLASNCSTGVTTGPYKIDQNAPTNPSSLSSSTHLVSTPSNINSVTVDWTNDAADGTGAGINGYSTLWDQSATTIPNTTIEKFYFELTETSASLADGEWYFHLRTCDLSGLCASATHLGPFVIDTSDPTNPTVVSSSSHETGVVDTEHNQIVMTWGIDAADIGMAGLQGYSIIWDTLTNTTPDAVVDIPSTTYTATSEVLENGTWYFHLRTCDTAGNCSAAVHAGPYLIDKPDLIPPTNPLSISSTSHTTGAYSNDTTVDIAWSDDADDTGGSGLAGYSTLWDQAADTLPDMTIDHEITVLTETSTALLDGSWYFHLRTCDNDGNCSDAMHSGPYQIDTMVPTNTSSVYSTSHTINVPSTTDKTIDITWPADASDGSGSGIVGVSIVWDMVMDTIPDNTVEISNPITTTTSPELSNGLWYFHIRTCDAAGNCSDTLHSGPYIINVPTDPICGTISSNRVWGEDLYTVTCSVTISAGVTVTVLPGAVIKFNSASYLLTVNGTLNVQGTATKPAIFTSSKDDTAWGDTNLDGDATAPAAGDWAGIYVTDTGVVNLDYVEVRYGGYNSTYQANLYLINNARATIENSRISFSKYNGIRINTTTTGKATSLTVRKSTIENNLAKGILINTSTTFTNPVEVTSSIIQGNGSHALETANVAGLIFNNNQLHNNNGYAAYLTLAGRAVPNLTGITGSGNTINGIGIVGPFTVTQTLTNLSNLVYVIPSSGWTISSGVTLTIPAGQVVKTNGTSAFIRPNGVLIAQGTDLARISFTSLKDDSLSGDSNADGTATLPAKGDWQGITVPAGGKAVLDYTAVMYAGNTGSAFDALVRVDEGASLTLTNSTLEHSAQYGVYVNGIEDQAILNNTIQDCASYGIYIYDNDADILPTSPEIRGNVLNANSYPIFISSYDGYTGDFRITDNTGSGNTYNYIRLEASLKGSVKLGTSNGFEWVFDGSPSVSTGATWTVGPDEVIKLKYDHAIYVYGSLLASNTADHPAVFTHFNDNEYGHPIGSGSPVKGTWEGIYVKPGATAVFNHAVIRYGGEIASTSDAYALVRVDEGASLTLTNSTLEHSAQYGVYVNSSNHLIAYNYFKDIASYGVFNGNTTEIIVKAENNWWGSSSGPRPLGSGIGVNYRTCYNSILKIYYVCQLYVDVDPWTGKDYYMRQVYGQRVRWQYYDADPVNTANGNYAYALTDLSIPIKGELDFAFQRSYNSLDPSLTGVMGYGWQHNYHIKVEEEIDHVLVTYGDGAVSRFEITETGYLAPVGNYDTLSKEADGTFRLLKKDQTRYVFDPLGRIVSINDRNGHGLVFNYLGTNLSTIRDTGGRTLLAFTYTDSRLTQITDVISRTATYTYDEFDNLASVTDMDGGVTTFTYDTNHRLLSITDANLHTFLTNQYDSEGRVIKQWDAEGYTTEFFYNTLDYDTLVTDRRGKVTKYDYDELGRLLNITNPLNHITSYTFDANNNITSVNDPRGFTTSYSYDERGNRLTTTDALSGVTTITYDPQNNPLTVTDAQSSVTTYTYDSLGNRLTEQDPLGNTSEFSYFTTTGYEGLLKSSRDTRGNITYYGYTNNGDLSQVTNALGHVNSYTYDNAGRKLSETNARGFTTLFTYDNHDRPLTITDALGGVTSTTYDAVGNKVSETDANGNTTTYTYSPRDKLLTLTDPAGYVVTYTYDAAENLVSITDGNGHTTSRTYDAINRKITETNALAQTTTYTYDANGNVIKVTDPLTHAVTTTYDALNRPITVSDPLSHTSTTTYDAVGNKTSFTDANAHTTTYIYDARNQMTSVTDALGGTVTYTFDAAGNRTAMTDANSHVTAFTYNALNRLSTITNPLGFVQSTTYDQNGNTSSVTNANGETTTYVYDNLDRQTAIQYADETDVAYTYDAVGNRLTMVDSTGTTIYIYDNLNRPASITSPAGTTSYTYDARNRLTLTTPAGTTTYLYNANDQLQQVEDWNADVTTYAYDAAGRLVTTTLPNGVVTTNAYDIANRLTGITHKKGTVVLESFAYTMDNVGNRLTMTDADGVANYTYDILDRISSVTYPSGSPVSVAYTYDPMGNRLTMTRDGVVTAYTYDAADRLVSKTGNEATTTYSWDNDGNMLTKGDQTLTWNKAGKLATWDDTLTSTSYTYDGDGMRIGYTVNSIETTYLQDAGTSMPLALRETTAGSTIDYVYGNDLISQVDTEGTSYLLTDGLGSSRLLTDETGAVVGRYSYDVFGEVRTKTGTNETDFTFAGEQMDTETGLQYLRARYYDPEDGRFITVDTARPHDDISATINRYVYAGNNPIINLDPSGLDYTQIKLSIGAYLGIGGGIDIYLRTDDYGKMQLSYKLKIGGGFSADTSITASYNQGKMSSGSAVSTFIDTPFGSVKDDLQKFQSLEYELKAGNVKVKVENDMIKSIALSFKANIWKMLPIGIKGGFETGHAVLAEWNSTPEWFSNMHKFLKGYLDDEMKLSDLSPKPVYAPGESYKSTPSQKK